MMVLQTVLLAVNVVRSTGFWLYLKGRLMGFTNGLKVECGKEKSVIALFLSTELSSTDL